MSTVRRGLLSQHELSLLGRVLALRQSQCAAHRERAVKSTAFAERPFWGCSISRVSLCVIVVAYMLFHGDHVRM